MRVQIELKKLTSQLRPRNLVLLISYLRKYCKSVNLQENKIYHSLKCLSRAQMLNTIESYRPNDFILFICKLLHVIIFYLGRT
jgi:hypothetical protein